MNMARNDIDILRYMCCHVSPNRLNTLRGTLWYLRGSWKLQTGFEIQIFPKSIKYATANVVASYAVLGSGKLVFRSKCSLNRLNTSQGTLLPLTCFLEVVNWFSEPNVPETIKYATGNMVASYAVLGGVKLVFRSKCSPSRLHTSQGTLWPLTRFLEVVFFRSKCSLNPVNTSQGTLWPLTRFLELVNWFFRSKCSLNRLNTPQGL